MKRLLALFLIAAFAACTRTGGGPQGAARNSWTIAHTLRITVGEDITGLNPMLTSDTPVTGVLAPLTMAYLVRWNALNQPVPELATDVPSQANGGVSRDGLTITYHLRRGVRWSDGAPFTADDVVFSIHAVLNPANNVTSRSGWDRIGTIDKPDNYTVVLHMTKPYSPFLQTFFSTAGANPALLPKHLLAQYPNLNHVAYNAKPVGIGPFKVDRWERSQRVVLVANPLYWRGPPKLQRIEYEIITDNNTILTQLQTHNLDMWYLAPQNVYDEVKNLRGFDILLNPTFYFRHVDFNLSSPKLADPAVRQALRYASDRPTILAKVYHGIGILQEQPAPKVSAYWDPSIKQVSFDLTEANRLLDGAGWRRGADGIRAKNGVRLNLNFATASGTVINDQLIEQLRQTWKQIGVAISVSHYQNNLLFAQYQDGGILYRGKFDVAYFAWGVDAVGDMSTIYACDEVPPSGQNLLHWCNQTANKAMHDLYAHYDQADRNRDDAIVMEQLNQDVPTVVIMGTEGLWVYNKDITNFKPGSLAPFDLFTGVDV